MIEPRIEHNDASELEEAAECRHRQHAVRIIESRTHPVCRCRERSEKEDPKHADDHTEDDVRQRRAPHREAAADHHQPGRRRRSDTLPNDHRTALLERQGARVQRNQRRCSGSGRALHDDRHEDPDPGEDPPRAETPAGKCLEIPRNASHPRLQEVDPGEDQSEAREDRSQRSRLAACDQPEKGADAEHGQGRGRNPEAQTEDGD